MATGLRPFTGNTTAALYDAIVNKAPVSLGDVTNSNAWMLEGF